jgi:23S rRNA (cytosine1962-C5)-methyltransferase
MALSRFECLKNDSFSGAVIKVKQGREKPFLSGHPWVFSGALLDEPKGLSDGVEVCLRSQSGKFIGYGLYNSNSQIRVRIYSWKEGEFITDSLLAGRISSAVNLRKKILGREWKSGGCRLVFSEADLISGLTVDCYAGHLSVQITSLALYQRVNVLVDALCREISPLSIMLRTEKGIREQEGLEVRDGVLHGSVPTDEIEIVEHDLVYKVNLAEGHKTGFYLDQRDNRKMVRLFSAGKRCLDMCCYSGGFSMNAIAGGAVSCVAADASQSAIEIAEKNVKRNNVSSKVSFMKGDAFKLLEGLKERDEKFDLIVLDPPRFAQSGRGVDQAVKGYVGLNSLAISILNPDGVLVTCSCSGRVGPELFRGAIRDAACSENRILKILEERGAASDHPINPAVPETEYLKCFICAIE